MNRPTRAAPAAPDPPVESVDRGVVAAVDESSATGLVLATARHLGTLLELPVTAVHVEEDPASRRAVEAMAAQSEVPVRMATGDPIEVLADLSADPGVGVLVVGFRALPSNRRTVGHLAGALLRRATRTLVMVPPADRIPQGPIVRVLAPLDDDPRCGAAVEPMVARLRRAECEVLGLHVFETRTVPSFLDHPGHGTASWRDEFARRHGMRELELRRGAPGRRILETARDRDVDLVLMAWSRVLDDVHGAVVGEVLTGAEVPVMLVPADVPAPRDATP